MAHGMVITQTLADCRALSDSAVEELQEQAARTLKSVLNQFDFEDNMEALEPDMRMMMYSERWQLRLVLLPVLPLFFSPPPLPSRDLLGWTSARVRVLSYVRSPHSG
jgi:hypothetical protein